MAWLSQREGGVCLSVKVQPRASRNEVVGVAGDELKIRVTAPPVDSAANEAVLDLLAEILGCPRNLLQLLRGRTSPHKQVFVSGVTVGQVATALKTQ